jgi:hypothetical protein
MAHKCFCPQLDRTVDCYHPCNAGCCVGGVPVGRGTNPPLPSPTNPADPRSFGFNTSHDGRIRGGIKTPDYTTMPPSKKEFNIFEAQREATTNNFNSNAPNSIKRRTWKPHPLDLLGVKRVIGATVFDPVTKTWKVDDGRPRGWDDKGLLCWGKCKVRRGVWPFRTTTIKCNCNKAGDGCQCDGCLGGAAC